MRGVFAIGDVRSGSVKRVAAAVVRHITRLPRRSRRYCFEHPVGAAERRDRNSEAERLGGLEVDDQTTKVCEGFRKPAVTNVSPRTAAGVRKPPRDETAGRGTRWAVPRAQLWGFGHGRATAKVGGAVG